MLRPCGRRVLDTPAGERLKDAGVDLESEQGDLKRGRNHGQALFTQLHKYAVQLGHWGGKEGGRE